MFSVSESLLRRLGVSQGNESLMGDLVEEYSSGRSILWLWRETVIAIMTKTGCDLRNHKLIALRAIATGWLLLELWAQILPLIDVRVPGYWLLFLLLFEISIWPAFVGWVVGRTHRLQQAAMVLAYAASIAAYSIWYYCLHYVEITRMSTPDQLFVGIASLATVSCTLIGGLLQKPNMPPGLPPE